MTRPDKIKKYINSGTKAININLQLLNANCFKKINVITLIKKLMSTTSTIIEL